jgi:signal transduction histidine kinase
VAILINGDDSLPDISLSKRIALFLGQEWIDPAGSSSSVARFLSATELADIEVKSVYFFGSFVTEDSLSLKFSLDVDLVLICASDEEVPEALQVLRFLRLSDEEPVALALYRSLYQKTKLDEEVVSSLFQKAISFDLLKSQSIWRGIRASLRHRERFTESKRLILRLSEAQLLLEEKNKRLDSFSATVAHDLRSPLCTICMRLDLALEKLADSIPESIRSLLVSSLKAGENLSEMVQGIYDFAKLGASSGKVELVVLNNLVDEIFADLKMSSPTNVVLSREDLPNIWGYQVSIRRLLMNLVANAIKYNESIPPRVSVGLGPSITRSIGSFVTITISDNGIGIPEEEVPFLFDLGFRGRKKIKIDGNSRDGIGFGLAVVRRIIDQHFGTINVQSRVGSNIVNSEIVNSDIVPLSGTVFTCTLPATPDVFDQKVSLTFPTT